MDPIFFSALYSYEQSKVLNDALPEKLYPDIERKIKQGTNPRFAIEEIIREYLESEEKNILMKINQIVYYSVAFPCLYIHWI